MRRVMTIGAIAALLAVLLAAGPLLAQATVRYGLVMEPARGALVRAWGDSAESGYCVTAWHAAGLASDPRDTVYRVTHLGPVQRTGATADGVLLRCPRGAPTLHVHVPAQQGLATDCNPSRPDRAALARSGAPFDVVQCGIASFVFLFPPERSATPSDRWLLFAGLLGAGLAANAALPIDRDAGGYPVRWYWRKELAHAGAAAGLTLAGSAMSVRPWKAAALTCLAGAAFEPTQRHVHPPDIVADCLGAALAWGWVRLWRPQP
jgi:hypothetical protein